MLELVQLKKILNRGKTGKTILKSTTGNIENDLLTWQWKQSLWDQCPAPPRCPLCVPLQWTAGRSPHTATHMLTLNQRGNSSLLHRSLLSAHFFVLWTAKWLTQQKYHLTLCKKNWCLAPYSCTNVKCQCFAALSSGERKRSHNAAWMNK